MKLRLFGGTLALLLAGNIVAQSPVIVQPANQAGPVSSAGTQSAPDGSDVGAAMKSFEEMKTANEDLLKKQQAVLEALDQLQKDADQLRIYAKRG